MSYMIFTYNDVPIRTFVRDNDVWMHANDIGKALGFKRGVKSVVCRLGVENINELPAVDIRGHMQYAYVLNDARVRMLLEKVDKKVSEPFQTWYNNYIYPYIKSERANMKRSTNLNGDFYEDFLKAHEVYMTTAEVAQDFNKSERWMREALLKWGFLVRNRKGNIVVNRKGPNGRHWTEWEDEKDKTKYDFKWTSTGIIKIMHKMREYGYKTIYG